MPAPLAVALGVLGAVALARVIVLKTRRADGVMDAHRTKAADDTSEGERPVVRLQRDPTTGAYRPARET